MHIIQARIVADLLTTENGFHLIGQAVEHRIGNVFKFQLSQRGCGKDVFRVGLKALERVVLRVTTEFEIFSAEARRVIGDRKADEVAFAGIGKIRLNFH